MKYTNFTISAIHILPACDDKLRNCLKEDWYFFNDRVGFDKDGYGLVVNQENPYLTDYYGRNIRINALVGVNGSGKSSLLEMEQQRPFTILMDSMLNFIMLLITDWDVFLVRVLLLD